MRPALMMTWLLGCAGRVARAGGGAQSNCAGSRRERREERAQARPNAGTKRAQVRVRGLRAPAVRIASSAAPRLCYPSHSHQR